MKKKCITIGNLPSFPVLRAETLGAKREILDIFLKVRRNVRTLSADRSFQQKLYKLKVAALRTVERRLELYEACRDQGHRRNVARLIDFAERTSISLGDALCAYAAILEIHDTQCWDLASDPVVTSGFLADVDFSDPETKRTVSVIRDGIGTIADVLIDSGIFPGKSGFIRIVAKELCSQPDGWGLFAFNDVGLDCELIDDVVIGRKKKKDVEEAIAEADCYIELIRKRYLDSKPESDVLLNRLQVIVDNVVKPLGDQIATDSGEQFCRVFALIAKEQYVSLLATKTNRIRSVADFEAIIPAVQDLLNVTMMTNEFWHAVLAVILANNNGLRDRNTLREGAREIVLAALYHPAKLRKLRVPQSVDKLKSVVAKIVAPCFLGADRSRFTEETALGMFADKSDSVFLGCIAAVMSRMLDPDGWVPVETENKETEKADEAALAKVEAGRREFFDREFVAANRLWDQLLIPNVEVLLHRYAIDVHDAIGTGAAGLLDRPELQDEPLAVVELPAVSEPVTFYYVANPASEAANEEALTLAGPDDEETFHDFLTKKRVTISLKAGSLLAALNYFREMPPEHRNLIPKMQSATGTWRKIKRGKMRILARVEPDGRLLFHVYQRKEWAKGMFKG